MHPETNRCAASDKTDHVEGVALGVEVVVGLQYVAVARGLHRYHLLLHFYMSARVSGFKNLQSIDTKQKAHFEQHTLTANLSALT